MPLGLWRCRRGRARGSSRKSSGDRARPWKSSPSPPTRLSGRPIARGRASRRRAGCWRLEEADQIANGVVTVLGVPERQLFVHLVSVAAPVAPLRQVAGVLEVVDDLGRRPLGDADGGCDVPEPGVRVLRDALEHVGVVRYEPKAVVLSSGT